MLRKILIASFFSLGVTIVITLGAYLGLTSTFGQEKFKQIVLEQIKSAWPMGARIERFSIQIFPELSVNVENLELFEEHKESPLKIRRLVISLPLRDLFSFFGTKTRSPRVSLLGPRIHLNSLSNRNKPTQAQPSSTAFRLEALKDIELGVGLAEASFIIDTPAGTYELKQTQPILTVLGLERQNTLEAHFAISAIDEHSIKLEGPIDLGFTMQKSNTGVVFQSNLNLDNLDIKAPRYDFIKPASTRLGIETSGTLDSENITLNQVAFTLAETSLYFAVNASKSNLTVRFPDQDLNLNGLDNFYSPLKGVQVSGRAHLKGGLQKTSDHTNGDLSLALHADSQNSKAGSIAGDLLIDLKAVESDLDLNFDATGFEWQSPKISARKRRNIPLVGQIHIKQSPSHDLSATFDFTARQIKLNGQVKTQGDGLSAKLYAPRFSLSELAEFYPLLEPYQIQGYFDAALEFSGTKQAPLISGQIAASKVQFVSPGTNLRPTLDARILFQGDRIENAALDLKAPGNSLSLRGSLESFSHPNLNLTIQSPGLDIDKLLGLKRAEPHPTNDSIQKPWNPPDLLRKTSAKISLDLKSIQYRDNKIPRLKCLVDLNPERLNLKLEHIDFGDRENTAWVSMNGLETQAIPWQAAFDKKPFEVQFAANLQSSKKDLWVASGPIQALLKSDGTKTTLHADASALSIGFLPLQFDKRAQVPLIFDGAVDKPLSTSPSAQSLTSELHFLSSVLKLKGDSSHLQYEISDLDLEGLATHSRVLNPYHLHGKLSTSGVLTTVGKKATLAGSLELQKISLLPPNFKNPITLDGEAKFGTSTPSQIHITLTGPRTSAKFVGALSTLSPLAGTFELKGSTLDISQVPPTPETRSVTKPKSDLDGKLLAFANQPAMKAANLKLTWAVDTLFYDIFNLSHFEGEAHWKYPTLSLEVTRLSLLDGTLKNKTLVSLNKSTPQFQGELIISKLNLSQMLVDHFPKYRRTLVGIFDMDLHYSGISLNQDTLMKTFTSQGTLHASDAILSFADIGQAATQGINDGIGRVAQTFPMMKDRKVSPPQKQLEYDSIDSKLETHAQNLDLRDIQGKAKPQKGFDFSGKLSANLDKDAVDGLWNIVDTYNLTQAADLSVNAGGVQISRVLLDGDRPLEFPLHIGCKISQPCVDQKALPAKIADNLKNNIGRAAKSKITDAIGPKASQGLDQIKKAFGF